MKFFCPQCNAKYKIDDEKVRGRTLKMKCRQCGADINIHENMAPQTLSGAPSSESVAANPFKLKSVAAPSVAAPGFGTSRPLAPLGGPARPLPTDKLYPPRPAPHALSIQSNGGSAAAAAPNVSIPVSAASLHPVSNMNSFPAGAVWHVGINGVTVGPMNEDELGRKVRNGAVLADSMVWKQGWAQWQPLNQVTELSQLVEESVRLGPVGVAPVAPAPPRAPSVPPPLSPSQPAPAQPSPANRIPSIFPSPPTHVAPPSVVPPPERTSVVKWTESAPGDVAIAIPGQRPEFERPKASLPAGAWIAIAGSAAFGVTLALMVGKKWLSDSSKPVETQVATPNEPPPPQPTSAKPDLEFTATELNKPTGDQSDRKRGKKESKREAKKADEPKAKVSSEHQSLLSKMEGDEGGGPKGLGALTKEADQPKGDPLSADQLRTVITKNRPALQRCYEVAARGTQQSGAVRLDVEVTVGPSGVVLRAIAEGRDLGNIKDCIQSAIKKWRFPQAGDTTETSFPVVFQPGG